MHLFEFCRYYDPDRQEHDTMDLHRMDLEDGTYSVMTKTLEDVFKMMNPYQGKKECFFKNIRHEEKICVTIYFSFLKLLQDHVVCFYEKYGMDDQSTLNDDDDNDNEMIDQEFIHLFFSEERQGLNLLRNVENYENPLKKESFQNQMNDSIYFNILFRHCDNQSSTEWSYEECYKLFIRYIFVQELYFQIRGELLKCKKLYGDNFILQLPPIQNKTVDCINNFETYTHQVEEKFLKRCESGIFNIHYAVDPTIYPFDYSLFHLDYREIRENIRKEVQHVGQVEQQVKQHVEHQVQHAGQKSLFSRKLKRYMETMESDMNMWKKFKHYFQDWQIDLVFNIMRKYPLEELKVISLRSFYKSFFSMTVMKSILVHYQEKNLTRHIRERANDKDFRIKNFFPKFFKTFVSTSRGEGHLILQTFFNTFPLNHFNFNKNNLSLWYPINVIELYEFEKFRNMDQGFETFQGPLSVKFPSVMTVNPTPISPHKMLKFLRKTIGLTKKSTNSFLVDFTEIFRETFVHFFKRNLKKKLSNFDVRKQFIENNLKWQLKENRLYLFLCEHDLTVFDQVVESETNILKDLYLPREENYLFSEKWRTCFVFFKKKVCGSNVNIAQEFLFMMELLTGLQIRIDTDLSSDDVTQIIKCILKELSFRLERDKDMIYNLNVKDSLFSGKNYLKVNFKSFIVFLKKVELIFFPIEEKKYQLEEVIHIRVKMLLEKDIYQLLLSV